MGIDSKKLKKTLEKHHIIILEYFCIDGDCAMLKCFLAKSCEYLLIYISSSLRFEMNVKDFKNAYELQDVDENTENDDYSKSGKVPDMDTIDEEKSVNSYRELTKKYQKSITLDPNDEPIQRKLKRQIDRLKQPFKRLNYDLSIQNGKYLSVAFGDDISMFSIKSYNNSVNQQRYIMYLVNVNDFIETIEEIDEHISIIKKQFYDIIKKVSLSNLESIQEQVGDYKSMIHKITNKTNEYEKMIDEYLSLYKDALFKENELVKEYKNKIDKEQGVKKSSLEIEYEKVISELYKSKIDIIRKGILLASKYHSYILILEEASFDNSIMLERVSNNFNLLKQSFS